MAKPMSFSCQVTAQRPSSKGLRIDRSPGPHGWDLRPAKCRKVSSCPPKKWKKTWPDSIYSIAFDGFWWFFFYGVAIPRHQMTPAMVKHRMPSYLGRPIHGSADACREAPLQTWPLKAAIGPWPGGTHKNHQSWPTNLESMWFLDIFG